MDLTQFWIPLAVMLGVVFVGVVILLVVDRWRKRPDMPDDQLSHFQSLYSRGELSREEFERVRGLLMGQPLRKSSAAPSAYEENVQTRTPPPRWDDPASRGPSPPEEGIRPRPPDPPVNGSPPEP